MVKTVMDNWQVAHVFAQQEQQEGRSHNGNMHFNGDTLYSYSTPIARVVSGKGGGKVALITTHKYSATTSGKHMAALNGAFGYEGFRVPSLGCGSLGRHREPDDNRVIGAVNHAANLAHLLLAYDDEVSLKLRKLSAWDRMEGPLVVRSALDRYLRKANAYARAFGLEGAERDPIADYARIMAANAARNTPEVIAKREAAASKRKAKTEASRAAWELDARKAWREGYSAPTTGYARHGVQINCENGGAMLRLKGDTVHTSWHAQVPLDHARKLFRFIKAVRTSGKAWHTNGSSIHVGHFSVNSIEASGDFKAGCHQFYWPEVERFARLIGVYEDQPSLDALERRAA